MDDHDHLESLITIASNAQLTGTISPPGSSSSAILVVDDDPLVRAVTVDALEDEGFKVLETPTADDACAFQGW